MRIVTNVIGTLCVPCWYMAALVAAAEKTPVVEMPGARIEVYKTIADTQLKMYMYYPADHNVSDRRPAIVFFFGGGWVNGTPKQFRPHCEYLASRGMVAMAADYRVRSRQGTAAIACVQDGKSAVRWIRKNADRLGVDPQRVVAGGGSAGGHVAACAGVVAGLDDDADDKSVSSTPNAMVLFNPVAATAPLDGEGTLAIEQLEGKREKLGVEPTKISPYHNVSKGAPPTIIFHGMADTTVRFKVAAAFAERMKDSGNRCELFGYEGHEHGFFNFGRGDGSHYYKTVLEMDKFLASLGYIKGEPTFD